MAAERRSLRQSARWSSPLHEARAPEPGTLFHGERRTHFQIHQVARACLGSRAHGLWYSYRQVGGTAGARGAGWGRRLWRPPDVGNGKTQRRVGSRPAVGTVRPRRRRGRRPPAARAEGDTRGVACRASPCRGTAGAARPASRAPCGSRGRGHAERRAGFLSVNCFYVYISMPLHASRRGCGVDRCLASGSRVPVCGVRSGLEVAALRPALPVRAARRGSRGGRCRKALDSREPSGVAACSHRRRGRVSGRAAEEARLSQGMLLFMRLGERSR